MRAPDVLVAEVAARQHGVVSARQLADCGLTRDAVAHRVRHRRLTPLHRGVYRVGPLSDSLTSLMAATLACGAGAALSHRAAAHLHGFGPEIAVVDVIAPAHPRSRTGIRVRRAVLTGNEVTVVDGIPVTTPERTIRDLATVLPRKQLERAIEEAQIQRKLDHITLTDAVDKHRGHRGARALRAAASTSDPQLTRSEAERKLSEVIRSAGLPRPQTNARIGGYEVDAVWRRERLVVEVDGFAFHGSRYAFERDRRKDQRLTAEGWRVLRVTWRQLVDEREAVAARLGAALARAA